MTDFLQSPAFITAKISFHRMQAQAWTGIQFDRDAAVALLARIEVWMKEIEDEIEPKLPPRKLKKSEEKDYTFPAKPFKQDGRLSVHGERFLEKHGLELIGVNHIQWQGKLVKIEGNKQLPATAPMTLGNQEDIKEYLLSEGWVPSLWNLRRDANGKPARDDRGQVIQTSPKFQENGRLCENLEAMSGDLVRPIVKWLSMRNRHSVLKGWLENPRLDFDGRLSAGSSGWTNTFREKHNTVVNLPKAEEGVTLGKEIRSLFIARPGNVLVGYDASALENRIEAHYVYRYPGGPEYAEELLSGDPHKKNAFVFYPEQLAGLELSFDSVDKDDPRFKPFRSKSKNGKYALTYGCSPRKLGSTLGLPEYQGEQLYEAFWEANKPLAMFRDAVTRFWETEGEKKWVKAIDGRRLPTRSKHSLVNTLFQSAGSIAVKVSGIFMDKWLGGLQVDNEGYPCYKYKGYTLYRVAEMHDELVFDCPPAIAEEIGRMGVRSIEKAGEYLKVRVPLTGAFAIGPNWAEIH